MRNDKYVRIIHRRKVLRELQAYVRDRYLLTNEVTKTTLICEDAPYLDREVSQDAFLEVSGWLELIEREETMKLANFELVEKELELPKAVKEAVSPTKEKHVVKEKKRKARQKPPAEAAPEPGAPDQSSGETPPES